MAMSDSRSKNKRANLFLLRVWCDDTDEQEYRDESERPCRIWHGKVQRTVNGEVHSFDTKDRLIDVLEGMIYKELEERPEQSRPGRKSSSEAGAPEKGNNRIEANKGDHHVQ